mmetsp:Transcript_22501/g.89340  ORF Transcript_22501/g.89340 Transcript_22501/m.89340 type:complete len:1342 (+) Transcript_22501:131-4156(+)
MLLVELTFRVFHAWRAVAIRRASREGGHVLRVVSRRDQLRVGWAKQLARLDLKCAKLTAWRAGALRSRENRVFAAMRNLQMLQRLLQTVFDSWNSLCHQRGCTMRHLRIYFWAWSTWVSRSHCLHEASKFCIGLRHTSASKRYFYCWACRWHTTRVVQLFQIARGLALRYYCKRPSIINNVLPHGKTVLSSLHLHGDGIDALRRQHHDSLSVALRIAKYDTQWFLLSCWRSWVHVVLATRRWQAFTFLHRSRSVAHLTRTTFLAWRALGKGLDLQEPSNCQQSLRPCEDIAWAAAALKGVFNGYSPLDDRDIKVLTARLNVSCPPPQSEAGAPESNHLGECLCRAANNGDLHVLRALLLTGADPNYFSVDMPGSTPLHLAAAHYPRRYVAIVSMLLRCGGNPDASDVNGNTPLQLATNPDTAIILLQHRKRVKAHEFTLRERRWCLKILNCEMAASVHSREMWRAVTYHMLGAAVVGLEMRDKSRGLFERQSTDRAPTQTPDGQLRVLSSCSVRTVGLTRDRHLDRSLHSVVACRQAQQHRARTRQSASGNPVCCISDWSPSSAVRKRVRYLHARKLLETTQRQPTHAQQLNGFGSNSSNVPTNLLPPKTTCPMEDCALAAIALAVEIEVAVHVDNYKYGNSPDCASRALAWFTALSQAVATCEPRFVRTDRSLEVTVCRLLRDPLLHICVRNLDKEVQCVLHDQPQRFKRDVERLRRKLGLDTHAEVCKFTCVPWTLPSAVQTWLKRTTSSDHMNSEVTTQDQRLGSNVSVSLKGCNTVILSVAPKSHNCQSRALEIFIRQLFTMEMIQGQPHTATQEDVLKSDHCHLPDAWWDGTRRLNLLRTELCNLDASICHARTQVRVHIGRLRLIDEVTAALETASRVIIAWIMGLVASMTDSAAVYEVTHCFSPVHYTSDSLGVGELSHQTMHESGSLYNQHCKFESLRTCATNTQLAHGSSTDSTELENHDRTAGGSVSSQWMWTWGTPRSTPWRALFRQIISHWLQVLILFEDIQVATEGMRTQILEDSRIAWVSLNYIASDVHVVKGSIDSLADMATKCEGLLSASCHVKDSYQHLNSSPCLGLQEEHPGRSEPVCQTPNARLTRKALNDTGLPPCRTWTSNNYPSPGRDLSGLTHEHNSRTHDRSCMKCFGDFLHTRELDAVNCGLEVACASAVQQQPVKHCTECRCDHRTNDVCCTTHPTRLSAAACPCCTEADVTSRGVQHWLTNSQAFSTARDAAVVALHATTHRFFAHTTANLGTNHAHGLAKARRHVCAGAQHVWPSHRARFFGRSMVADDMLERSVSCKTVGASQDASSPALSLHIGSEVGSKLTVLRAPIHDR